MSVLETLEIIFRANTSQLKSETDDVAKRTQKLKQGFIDLDQSFKIVGESFINAAKQLGGLAASYITVNGLVSEFNSTIDYSTRLDQASFSLNVNTERLQAWGNAVRLTGGTVEGFATMIKTYAQHLGTTPDRALDQLLANRSKFQSPVSQFAALNYGRAIGIDDPTILLLRKSDDEIRKLTARQKELGLVTQKQADLAYKFTFQLGQLRQGFLSLSAKIGESVLPNMTKFLVVLQNIAIFLRHHNTIIKGALLGIGIAAAAAGVGLLIFLAPLVATEAAVVLTAIAFGILYEEASKFFNHQDSWITNSKSKWASAARTLLETWKPLLWLLKEIAKLFEWEYGLAFGDEKPNKAKGNPNSSYDTNRTLAESIDLNILRNAHKNLDIAKTSQLNVLPLNTHNASNFFNNKPNNISIGEINIVTQATDALGVAETVSDYIKQHLSYTNNNSSNGIYI